MAKKENVDLIQSRVDGLPKIYPSLAGWPEPKLFSALCLKAVFFQSSSEDLREDQIQDDVLDGSRDGGVDILFGDPEESAEGDYYICQSKYYSNKISYDELIDAVHKLVDFYNNVKGGKHGNEIREDVRSKTINLDDELSEEGTVHFAFLTSTSIRESDRKKALQSFDKFKPDSVNSDLTIYDKDQINTAIKESELKKLYIEADELKIDRSHNVLDFSENDESGECDAAVCNISASSLKHLYDKYGNGLLGQNLRYYIRKRDVDNAIDNTIRNDPQNFWYKNNGITILCDDFDFSGDRLKMRNFSIINGGQTTYKIGNNAGVNEDRDFYLTCKVIRNKDGDPDFALNIAQATNSQKPIRKSDLKSNTPEQQHFYHSLSNLGVFYQMKRGDLVQGKDLEKYQKTKLDEVLKLALACVYQLPGTSRNHPSLGFDDQYYNPLFLGKSSETSVENQLPFSKITAQELYMLDAANRFIKSYSNSERSAFARNSRTACLAFVAILSRIKQQPELMDTVDHIHSSRIEENFSEIYRTEFYPKLADFSHFDHIFNDASYANKDELDKVLFVLFSDLVKAGYMNYHYMNQMLEKTSKSPMNETNYLKSDSNYYFFAYDQELLTESLEKAKDIF